MDRLTIYEQMTASSSNLLKVLKDEIGLKSNCAPFAIKAIEALKGLGSLNETEALNATNVFLAHMQTLNQGGILADDHDKIDMVKRGKTITLSARVEAFYRAAARKGYRITDTIVAVPKEDGDTTYFKEQFHDGDIVYVLEDQRKQGDRKITGERLDKGYFDKFLCRMVIDDVAANKRIGMWVCEMSNEDVVQAAKSSDNGLYKSKWEEYKDWGKPKKRKVITNELDTASIWYKWTSEMVAKTVIRRALKRVREVLPALKETIYAFEADDTQHTQELQASEKVIDIPIERVDVDLENLTESQRNEASETYAIFCANPKLAADEANKIRALFDGGASTQSLINAHYASIANICTSKKLYPIIQPLFEGVRSC